VQIGHNGSSRASAPPAIIPETPATRRGSFPQINHFLQLSMKQGNRPKCTAALARPFFTFRPSAANYLSSSVVIFNFAVPDITYAGPGKSRFGFNCKALTTISAVLGLVPDRLEWSTNHKSKAGVDTYGSRSFRRFDPESGIDLFRELCILIGRVGTFNPGTPSPRQRTTSLR
jgi:hypothetical protein